MIRLSVEQLNELQQVIQRTGEVHATILPKSAFRTDRLMIAWARSVNQEEFYLSIWKDEKSWEKAKTLVDVFAQEEEKQRAKAFEQDMISGNTVDTGEFTHRNAYTVSDNDPRRQAE